MVAHKNNQPQTRASQSPVVEGGAGSLKSEPMQLATLKDLYVTFLTRCLLAEQQTLPVIQELAKLAHSAELAQLLATECERTKRHIARLEIIFEQMGLCADPACTGGPANRGLLDECLAAARMGACESVRDAAIIAEVDQLLEGGISLAESLCRWAKHLPEESAIGILREVIDEKTFSVKGFKALADRTDAMATVPEAPVTEKSVPVDATPGASVAS